MADRQSRTYPNEYTENINFSSTGADIDFGFNAALVRIKNDATKPIYLTLRSTTGATTSGHGVYSSEDIQWFDIGCGLTGMSFVATSSGGFVRIGAWG